MHASPCFVGKTEWSGVTDEGKLLEKRPGDGDEVTRRSRERRAQTSSEVTTYTCSSVLTLRAL